MAVPHNQAIMVLHQEGATTSTLVPQTSACSLFVVVNQLHPGGARQEKQALFASTEASPLAKPSIGSCVPSFNKVSSMSLSAMAATNTSNQLCNLPAESTCQGITVTLDNNNMWNEFFRCQTEMILTKQGRRMFPCCRFRISGLEPFQRYTLVMDMQPVDNYRYKWSDRRWETNGKADPHITRSFVHPDSPATGLDWMQNPVSFYKLKLTNNPLDREGHIIINSMHRYIPRLHIIPEDKATDAIQLDSPDVVMFCFAQTEFFAVTAYQNLSITQLKIDYNPFAKGFRDDANNTRCGKPKNAPSTEKLDSEVKSSKESTTLNNLKSLFAKINASEKITTNGDLKALSCDGPRRAEPESSSSSMKRPWPGGLSELIKGAHVKVKRISLEKIRNGSSQETNLDTLASKENNMDVASKDCLSENISVTDEAKEPVSFSKGTDTSTLKTTTETFSTINIKHKPNEATSNTPLNENDATLLGETTALNDEKLRSDERIEETSQTDVKPLDCGEVKKKRAEPVPLPLLALFLQQLKSKTRPTRIKPPSEACSVPSQSDESCYDSPTAENRSPSPESFTPSLDTQLNVQPAASPTPQIIASSVSTCTVASTEHKTVSPSSSVTDAVAASTVNVVCDTLSTPNKVSDTTSAFVHNVKPNTSLSDIRPDKVFSDDLSSDSVPSCDPEASPATTPQAPDNELVHSNVTTEKSTTEPVCDASTVPCPEPAPEAPSPRVKTLPSPPCAPYSPYMSAPSSPDPFPPSMFSDRPVRPRKALDPFPLGLLLDRPKPLLELADPLAHKIFARPTPKEDESPPVFDVPSDVKCPAVSPDTCIQKEVKQSSDTSKGITFKVKQKKGGKLKLSEDTEEMEGPVPVPMQPNLEDVEGQLFVSFMSKKALEIHLGDEAKEEILQKTTEILEGEVHAEKESIDALEKVLLRDLKNMKHRQVIHPVLQAVGLKLNLLDVTLSIDLQYLGVCLPIPPPILQPEGSSGTCSSQVHFVSRTGKTSDVTKIKGWREKFSTTSSLSVPGVATPSETGQKNLSAFCSDMLDEYLESEGKLIDERAASFTQAAVSPVAYQLPTKSTSYVLTLDSVLKKQAFPVATAGASQKTALTSKSKELLPGVKKKKSIKTPVLSTDKKSGESSFRKSKKSVTSKSVPSVQDASSGLSQSKNISKIKTKKGTKTSLQKAEKPIKDSVSVAPARQSTSSSPGSNLPAGRSSSLPKTLVKLRDVEDGAVWEGKSRTYITVERAAIALSCLVTAEGTIGGSPSTVIKRRAPPCLNDFCRLGCVCASLVQDRRQHHCGKPQCMLGCDCLRRKVMLLKKDDTDKEFRALNQDKEIGSKVKKKKTRISYFLSGPDAAPEPAHHVKSLWVRQNDSDSEQLYIPLSTKPIHEPVSDLQKDFENFLRPSANRKSARAVDGEGLSKVKNQDTLDCARVRPFCWGNLPPCRQRNVKECRPNTQDPMKEIEEGELRPPTQSCPTKRLEIVSKCKWGTEGSRNIVLRTVCERMAQDRLKHPFWIGKFKIQPTSKTIKETDEGSIITYKVVISQPYLEESEEKKKEEMIKQLEARLIETIGNSEVKGLPLLSPVTPAGLLKADKKPPGTLGQIMVNGKLYPQAKLELGQMGALHPANRLAAYITGRVCVANKLDPKTVTTANKTSRTTPIATTTVTSTLSPAVTLNKAKVDKQVEISCVNLQQQQETASNSALPIQSKVKNTIISSSSVLTGSTGISESINMPPKASTASHASPVSGTTDGSIQVGKGVSGPTASEKAFVLGGTGSSVAISGSGIRLVQPLTSSGPAVPSQRTVTLKAANSAGQVIHFVPISQLKGLNPNIVIRPQQSTLIHLPTPNPVPLNKSQPSTTTESTDSSSATQDQNIAPVHSTNATNSISPCATIKPVTSVSGLKTLLFCNKPSAVKKIPGLLWDSTTTALRIMPHRVFEDMKVIKDLRNTSSVSSAQSSSEGPPAHQDSQLTSQNCSTSKVQDPRKVDNPMHTSTLITKESCKRFSQSFKMSLENVVFTDHSYFFETKKTTPSSMKPVDISKDSADPANGSTDNMLLKEVLDLGPVEEAEGYGISGSDLDTETGGEFKARSHLVAGEVDSDCTEVTEDSEMYNDTDSSQSSDKEDLCVASDSDGEEINKVKQGTLDEHAQDLSEKEDDELVDIETFETGAEKSFLNPEQMQPNSFHDQSSDEDNENLIKIRKRKDEKKRRVTLSNSFYNLQQTLNIEDPKVSKIALLSRALKEIHSLTKQRDCLMKTRDKMTKKRNYYIEMASQLSGKNKESISQKLDEIIAKQKSPKIEDKANDKSLNLKKRVPRHSKAKADTKQKKKGTSDEAEHSISKQEHLGVQDLRTENVRTNRKMTAAIPAQLDKTLNTCPTPQLKKYPSPIPGPRERTRPSILSRSKSQTLVDDQVLVPQVIPVADTVVSSNRTISISDPLQPIDMSLWGKRHSTTPENPCPVLQPQVLKLASSPVNTTGDILSLPKISSVVPSVQSEKLPFTPPASAVMHTQAACNSLAGETLENPSSDEVPLMEEERHLDKQLQEVLPQKMEHDATIKIDGDQKIEKEDERNTHKPEQEDDRLMSLLDELVFLNQTSEPQEDAISLMEASDELTQLFTNKVPDMNRDDERSLSPLFLTLDEDLMTSPASKDEMYDIPPKVDDLVKVIFGSESPSNSSESELVAAASDDATRVSVCHGKHDAPTPPPLLQMKTGACTTADSPKEQANLSWRPMPKLAPLGLKIQETGQPKAISPHASKSDSKLPSLHDALV